jgi:hypothetical protein
LFRRKWLKKLFVLLMTCVCFAVFSTQYGYAQDTQGPDHHESLFQLNSDMVRFDSPSPRLFFGWQRNANTLIQIGFDSASDYFDLRRSGTWALRLAFLTVFVGASCVVNQAFSLTAHDVRHMEAARATGAAGVCLVRNFDGPELSIWEFFFEAFNFTAEPGIYVYSKDNPTLAELAYVASEGLNTNMLIADMTGRKINEGAGHITDLAPYFLNKLWGINYLLQTGSTSDAANYLSLLNTQGHGTVTKENIIALHAASCLLSGGCLSLVRGTYIFIAEGDPRVRPLRLRIGEVEVFWPELTTWLNSENVSLLVSVDAAWRDLVFIRAGIDSPILGDVSAPPEFTFGVGVKINTLSLEMELTSRFARLPFFKGTTELHLSDTFSIGVEGFYGERNTMREIREYSLGPGAASFAKIRL